MANHDPRGRRSKASICAGLAGLLVLAPLAASAAELQHSFSAAPLASRSAAPGGGFTLGLDAVLSAQAADDRALDRVASVSAPSEQSGSSVSIATIDLRRVAVPMLQQSPAAGIEPATGTSGGFGTWLKRHWWVPALVGAAVIATAGEELWDDDDPDDED